MPTSGVVGAAIGEIKGRIHWQEGQLPSITIGHVGVRGQIRSPQDVIRIQPVHVTVTPSSGPGDFGSTHTDSLPGSFVSFGSVAAAGSALSVPYTLSNLPLDIGIQLQIRAEGDEGTFLPTGEPVEVSLDFENSVYSGLDFIYVP